MAKCWVEVEIEAKSVSEATSAVLFALSQEAPSYRVLSVSAREEVD